MEYHLNKVQTGLIVRALEGDLKDKKHAPIEIVVIEKLIELFTETQP